MSHADLTVRRLYANRRENPVLQWMTRGRGIRIGHLFFTLMMLGSIVASLAVANALIIQDEAEVVGFAAMAVYSLFVPFLLATAIPLSIKRVSPQQKQEIWTTPLAPREVAFGVLLAPLRMTVIIVTLYPLLLAAWLLYHYWPHLPQMIRGVSEPNLHVPTILLPITFLVALYLYYCAAAAYIPLLSRVRSFRIPWSPVLIGPIWAFGHVGVMTAILVAASEPYETLLEHIMGPGQARHDISSFISGGILIVVVISTLIVAWKSVIGRAGVRWLSDGVPHVAAELDWVFHDRAFAELSETDRRAAWSRFAAEAWLWWRGRLKWATLGLAASLLPTAAGLALSSWSEYRILGWGGLFAMPLLVPAMVFVPSFINKGGAPPPPLLHGRLLATSLILFTPCAVFCAAGVSMGLVMHYGFQLSLGSMIIIAFMMQILMTTFFVIPAYVVWVALLPTRGRGRLMGAIAGVCVLYLPAAIGIWTWPALAGALPMCAVLPVLSCTCFMGTMTLLMQRYFLLEVRGRQQAPDTAPE